MIYYILLSSLTAFWFMLLREPGEMLSFINTFANKQNRILKKIMTCGFCHTGYISITLICFCDANFIVLPASMITYKLINRILYG